MFVCVCVCVFLKMGTITTVVQSSMCCLKSLSIPYFPPFSAYKKFSNVLCRHIICYKQMLLALYPEMLVVIHPNLASNPSA